MNPLRAAWKAFRNPALVDRVEKYSGGASYYLGDLLGDGNGTQDRQLARNVFGATLAYQTVPEVKSALDVIAEALPTVPLMEKDAAGNVVARSDENPERSRLLMAILDSQQHYGIHLLSLAAYSLKMPGMAFIEITQNDFGRVGGLKWLNPQGIGLNTSSGGAIRGVDYINQDGEYVQLRPRQVIILRDFNPADDVYGYGTTLNIMGKANAVLNFDRMKISYYRNGAQPGIVISYKDKVSVEEAEKHIALWRRTMRGVDQFFKTHFSSIPADIEALEPVDMSKPLQVTIEDTRSILRGFRVPPEMIGDTTNNPYQFSPEKRYAFMLQVVQPVLDKILWGINTQAAPRMSPPGHKIYADYELFEVVTDTIKARQDMLQQEWLNGRISWNEYRQGNNYPAVEGGDFVMFPRDRIAIPAAQIAQTPRLLAEANAPQPIASPVSTDSGDVIPPSISADPTSNAVVTPRSFWRQDDPAADELRKWQAVAVKRYKEGNMQKALAFESDTLPAALQAAIRGALQGVVTVEQIYTIFDDGMRYLAHA